MYGEGNLLLSETLMEIWKAITEYEELYEGAFSAIRKNWFDTIRANAAALEQAAKGKIVQKRLEQSTELETLKSNYAVLKKEAEAQLQSLEAQWCEYENAL